MRSLNTLAASLAKFVSVFLVATGCVEVKSSDSGDTGLELYSADVESIAAGARFDVAVIDRCSDAEVQLDGHGPGKIPSTVEVDVERQTCELSEIESFDEAISTDPAVFSIEETRLLRGFAAVTLLAEGPGTATLETSISTSAGTFHPEGTYRVQAVNRLELTANCGPRGDVASTSQRQLVVAGERASLGFGLFNDDTALAGYAYHPFDVRGAEHEVDESARTIEFGPLDAGEVTITSPVDPELEFVIEAVSVEDVDAFDFEVTERESDSVVAIAPMVEGRSELCRGAFEFEVMVETPSVCELGFSSEPDRIVLKHDMRTSDERPSTVVLRPLADGACRIRARMVGGTYSETLELPTLPG